jgi:hypothetical protein
MKLHVLFRSKGDQMLPRTNIDLDLDLPKGQVLRLPEEDEISEEGFANFHDTWLIYDVSHENAGLILEADRRLVGLADSLAKTVDEYELIAKAIEWQESEDLTKDIQSRAEYPQLDQEIVPDDYSPLEGLELGVAGIVHCLSAAGFLPAASCRGHAGPRSWAPLPVVYSATDRRRAHALVPFVRSSGCGFAVDPERPDLLQVCAPSADEMLVLGRLILDNLPLFGPPVYKIDLS